MDKIKAAQLVLKHRANLRKIWIALGIAGAGLAAMLYYLLGSRAADAAHGLAYFGLSAVAVAALWLAGRLGRENLAIQRELHEATDRDEGAG